MKNRNAIFCLFVFAIAACGKQGAEVALPASVESAPQPAPAVSSPQMIKFSFDVPKEAVAAMRFDPTAVAGETILIRRIALVEADGAAIDMDPCAPTGVQRVRIGGFTRTAEACELIFGTDDNTGWMGLSPFNGLSASALDRHVEIEMIPPSENNGPYMLFDTGRGYNFEQRVRGVVVP